MKSVLVTIILLFAFTITAYGQETLPVVQDSVSMTEEAKAAEAKMIEEKVKEQEKVEKELAKAEKEAKKAAKAQKKAEKEAKKSANLAKATPTAAIVPV